jgi:predicted enzyme related to lactoylglutathione lyase
MPTVSINIDVDDLEVGVAFYAAAVGLMPNRRLGDFAVELSGAQAPVFLLRKAPATPAFAGAAVVRDYARHWTPVHLDFLVEELAGARARAGARAESAIETYPWGRLALLADPFGNGFCLIELDAAGYGRDRDAVRPARILDRQIEIAAAARAQVTSIIAPARPPRIH